MPGTWYIAPSDRTSQEHGTVEPGAEREREPRQSKPTLSPFVCNATVASYCRNHVRDGTSARKISQVTRQVLPRDEQQAIRQSKHTRLPLVFNATEVAWYCRNQCARRDFGSYNTASNPASAIAGRATGHAAVREMPLKRTVGYNTA